MTNYVEKSAKGLSVLILMKICVKIVQLGLNFANLRVLDPKIYGLTTH
jgi:hypothetical protein